MSKNPTPFSFSRLLHEISQRSLPSPATLTLVSAFLLVLTTFLKPILMQGAGAYLSVVVLQIIIFLLPVGIWIRLSGDGYLSQLRLKPGKPETILLSVSAAVLLISGGLLLSMLFSGINNLTGTFTLYETFRTNESGGFSGPALYLILAYAALPAICEELVFRGVLLAEYERHGVSISVLASTVLFASLHFNFGGIPVYLFSGFVLAVTTYLGRSVWGAIIAHFIYNLFGLFGQPYISSFYDITGSTALFLFIIIFFFVLSLAVFCGESARLCRLYATRNIPHLEPPKARDGTVVPFRVRLKAVFLVWDAIAAIGLWLIASIVFLFV